MSLEANALLEMSKKGDLEGMQKICKHHPTAIRENPSSASKNRQEGSGGIPPQALLAALSLSLSEWSFAPADASDMGGFTPAHYAVKFGYDKIVDWREPLFSSPPKIFHHSTCAP